MLKVFDQTGMDQKHPEEGFFQVLEVLVQEEKSTKKKTTKIENSKMMGLRDSNTKRV